MRTTILTALVSISLAAACGGLVEVRTMAAPDANLRAMSTFRLLPGAVRRDGRPSTGNDDPMVTNSIANRAMRERITRSLQDRGYIFSEINPDVVVAFYAAAHQTLDVAMWDYGHPFPTAWAGNPRQGPAAAQYTEGSVVIDVLKPGTRELLWRGEGRAQLSGDPVESVRLMVEVAEAIVAKLPSAAPRFVAERR